MNKDLAEMNFARKETRALDGERFEIQFGIKQVSVSL